MTLGFGTKPDGEPYIQLVSPVEPDDVEVAGRTGISDFWVHLPSVDYRIDFLPMFSDQISQLRVWGSLTVQTLRPLETLHQLEFLNVDAVRWFDADLGKLPSLRRVAIEWSRGADSIFDCADLNDLYIYNFPDHDLARVARLKRLRNLQVGPSRRLKSLAGVDELANLRFLGVYYAPFLVDISPLTKVRSLERLYVAKCKRACKLEIIAGIKTLTWLTLEGCAELPSLSPLAGHPALQKFYSDTNVLDGDMTALLRIPSLRDVIYQNRRHYSHTMEEIDALLREKPRSEHESDS